MRIKEIVEAITAGKEFFVFTHTSPEGDAVGSQLGLARLLKREGKSVFMIGSPGALDSYSFLPGINQIKKEPPARKDADVAIAVDCAAKERMGEAKKYFDKANITINIDHHATNTGFADINWVEPEVSSVGEMIYRLYGELGREPDKADALCLYVAILTDTGSFRYANTTSRTYEVAAKLLEKGVRPEEAAENIYQSFKRQDIALLAEVLRGMNITADGRIAWSKVTESTLSKAHYSELMLDNLVSYPRSIKGVEVAILFRDVGKDRIRVNFRSKHDADVTKLAAVWGGGGHPRASGCTATGKLEEIEKRVIEEARKQLDLCAGS